MKKLIFKIVFAFVVLPLSLVGALYYLDQLGFFNITKVEVVIEDAPSGQEHFLRPNVEKLQESLSRFEGVSLWVLRLKAVAREVRSLNWVEDLNVKRSWPSALTVYVRPYEVKLLLMSKKGELVPVIKDGSLLSPVETKQAPDVILIDGNNFSKNAPLRKKAVEVLDQIPTEGAFSKKTISEIRYDDKEGFWMTMIKTGIRVKMGEDQISLRSARVSQVVDYLESRQFDARVIDANLSKKVLVRLRKGP